MPLRLIADREGRTRPGGKALLVPGSWCAGPWPPLLPSNEPWLANCDEVSMNAMKMGYSVCTYFLEIASVKKKFSMAFLRVAPLTVEPLLWSTS